MASTELVTSAPPEAVWRVLADARHYGHWVVGSKRIRDYDPSWPAVGSKFHHTVGTGPLKVDDHTVVEAATPPTLLRLRAKARPLGTFIVVMGMEPVVNGTRITMTEFPADRLTRLIYNPLTKLLIRGRNVVALDRLSELAEGRGPSPRESQAE